MKKNNFTNIAREVIETEIQSLRLLKKSLGSSFNKAVEAILNCKNGKVIISGVGTVSYTHLTLPTICSV